MEIASPPRNTISRRPGGGKYSGGLIPRPFPGVQKIRRPVPPKVDPRVPRPGEYGYKGRRSPEPGRPMPLGAKINRAKKR